MDGWERDEENQTQERQNQKETTTTTTTAAVAAEKLNTWYSLCMYTTGTHQLIIWFLSAGVLTRWSDKRGAYVHILPALFQEGEHPLFMFNQFVQATVQALIRNSVAFFSQKVTHGAIAVPLAMQSPFASRMNQSVTDQRFEYVQPACALAAWQKFTCPITIQLQLFPQKQRQPASAPLSRPLQSHSIHMYVYDFMFMRLNASVLGE